MLRLSMNSAPPGSRVTRGLAQEVVQRVCYAHQNLPKRMGLSSPWRADPDGEEAGECFTAGREWDIPHLMRGIPSSTKLDGRGKSPVPRGE